MSRAAAFAALTLAPGAAVRAEEPKPTAETICGTSVPCLVSESLGVCVHRREEGHCEAWVDQMRTGATREAMATAMVCVEAALAGLADEGAPDARTCNEITGFRAAVKRYDNDARVLANLALCYPPDAVRIHRRVLEITPDDWLTLEFLARELKERGDRESLREVAAIYRRLGKVQPAIPAEFIGRPLDAYWHEEAIRLYRELGDERDVPEIIRELRDKLEPLHEVARSPRSKAEDRGAALARVCDTSAVAVAGISDCLDSLRAILAAAGSDRTEATALLDDALGDMSVWLDLRQLPERERRLWRQAAPGLLEQIDGLLAAGVDVPALKDVAEKLRSGDWRLPGP